MSGEQRWDDDRVTTVGLLFESSAGLQRVLEPRLLTDSGLSNHSFDVLIRLVRTPGFRLRMSELASQTTLTPSGLTRSVDRLEASGLVAREACPEDRRGAFAVLTLKGQAVMEEAMPLHVAQIGELLDGALTPQEEETLASLLRKLRDHIRGLGHSTACEESEAAEPVASGLS
ncbi:MAG TPA: MarR family winged helix-turn-helix transcriptional regulator [Acidimicrobiales bacterium]|jgi:DNA-binding MarR family transcriptional regulator|nr:MarR family winged helix-turn-helix transcriptional regulator [Acidimicrobiales bacterium]